MGKASQTEAVRYLRYRLLNNGTPGTVTNHFIDLARDLSAINRRLMRQGRMYRVKKVGIISAAEPNGAGNFKISTAPDSWVARQAWKRGFAFNKKQHQSVSGLTGSKPGSWADFKIYLNDTMRTTAALVPVDNVNNFVVLGEWNYSTMVTPDGTATHDEFELHLLGDHNGAAGSRVSVGLINSYGESRTTVQVGPGTPATASDDPLNNIFDAGTTADDIIDNIESENDNPPYSLLSYPGDATNMPSPIVVQETMLSDGKSVVGGFTAICGLVSIKTSSAVPNSVFDIIVELAPGNYRGIDADVI